jgi:hypothetical protein
MTLPFEEENLIHNEYIRVFNHDVEFSDLVWHRDREDRIIESIGRTDWMVQIDNELPTSLNREVFIPKGVWHRVIKGTGDLKIKLVKLK